MGRNQVRCCVWKAQISWHPMAEDRAFREGPCLLHHFVAVYCKGSLPAALQCCPFLLWWVYFCCKSQTKSYLAKKDVTSRPRGGLSAAAVPQNQGGKERSCSQVGDFSEDFIMLFPAARCFCCESLIKNISTHITLFLLAVLVLQSSSHAFGDAYV